MVRLKREHGLILLQRTDIHSAPRLLNHRQGHQILLVYIYSPQYLNRTALRRLLKPPHLLLLLLLLEFHGLVVRAPGPTTIPPNPLNLSLLRPVLSNFNLGVGI